MTDDDANTEHGTVVPHEALSASALRGLIEEFVTRAGTDYGAREVPLERKIADVMRQLERREVHIVFDPATGTTNIVPVR